MLERTDDTYSANMLNEEVEWQQKSYDGVINGSFYVSARNAGIPANHIQKIANLFQWRLNFAKDLKKVTSSRCWSARRRSRARVRAIPSCWGRGVQPGQGRVSLVVGRWQLL